MSNLSAFLYQNTLKTKKIKTIISDRFVDENGEIQPFEIQSITSGEDDEIRESCKIITKSGNKSVSENDLTAYSRKLVTRCVVFPDLNDKQLQDSYGVIGAEDVLNAMLLPGEYARLFEKVKEINGFNHKFKDLVSEVKN
ncbi:MAG: phage portal protein [Eubacterium sp.]|jgi:hypothetical protein|nr:phage portal protein [Eubacterium sp.]